LFQELKLKNNIKVGFKISHSKFLKVLKEDYNNIEKLRAYQINERKKIILKDGFSYPPSIIAGIDAAYKEETAYTACVSLNFKDQKILEKKVVITELKFPYMPGLFVFREGPPILKVYSKLEIKPDLLLINSHGISHPLGIGAASHIGILLNKPTIGVAQNKLCGNVEPPTKVGEISPLKYKGETVGFAYLAKTGTKPIYISPGHLISLKTSLKIVKALIKGYKLPEPLRLAHELANLNKSKQLI